MQSPGKRLHGLPKGAPGHPASNVQAKQLPFVPKPGPLQNYIACFIVMGGRGMIFLGKYISYSGYYKTSNRIVPDTDLAGLRAAIYPANDFDGYPAK